MRRIGDQPRKALTLTLILPFLDLAGRRRFPQKLRESRESKYRTYFQQAGSEMKDNVA